MEDDHRRFVQDNFKVLTSELDVDRIVPYMYCQEVLTSYDLELFCYNGSETMKMKAIDLCHMVLRRGPNAFYKFMLAISVMQPELFKSLCQDGATAMGRHLLSVEEVFLMELEAANQEANAQTHQSTATQTKAVCDSPDKIIELPITGSDQTEQSMATNTQVVYDSQDTTIELPVTGSNQIPDSSGSNVPSPSMDTVCKENQAQKPSSSKENECDVDSTVPGVKCEVEDDHTEMAGDGHHTDMMDEVDRIDPPLLTSTPKREKLSTTTPSKPQDGGLVDENAKVKTVNQMGSGNKSMTTYQGDMGPDRIQRDPRLEGHEPRIQETDHFTPKTIYPLSLRKYVAPGKTSDGMEYVRIKTVRINQQRKGPSIKLDRDQWRLLTEHMELVFVVQNMIATERDVSLCVHIGGGVFMVICPTYGTVDLRKYIPQGTNRLAVPSAEGVAITPREWRNLIMHKERINQDHFEMDVSDGVNCWLAGRHGDFLGPRKCPDCGYTKKRGSWSVRYTHLN